MHELSSLSKEDIGSERENKLVQTIAVFFLHRIEAD